MYKPTHSLYFHRALDPTYYCLYTQYTPLSANIAIAFMQQQQPKALGTRNEEKKNVWCTFGYLYTHEFRKEEEKTPKPY